LVVWPSLTYGNAYYTSYTCHLILIHLFGGHHSAAHQSAAQARPRRYQRPRAVSRQRVVLDDARLLVERRAALAPLVLLVEVRANDGDGQRQQKHAAYLVGTVSRAVHGEQSSTW